MTSLLFAAVLVAALALPHVLARWDGLTSARLAHRRALVLHARARRAVWAQVAGAVVLAVMVAVAR